jgi:hypothetical protein
MGAIIGRVIGLAAGVSLSDVLKFLSSPAGVALLIGLAFVGGDLWGRHKANERWTARFQESVRNAAKTDVDAAREAEVRAKQQAEAGSQRLAEIERRIDDYRKTVRDDCKLGLDDLDPGGVPNPAVRPGPTPAPGH